MSTTKLRLGLADQGRRLTIPEFREADETDGLLKSAVFPGLWLDPQALLAGDLARVLAVLNQGTASPEHAAFVKRLEARTS